MSAAKAAAKRLLHVALGYPGAWEDHPWDHTVIKVKKSIFAFVDVGETGKLHVTVKLGPVSHGEPLLNIQKKA